MNRPPTSNPTRFHPYLGRPCSNRRSQWICLTRRSHHSHTYACTWLVRGHTDTKPWCVCVTYVLSTLFLFHTIPILHYLRLPGTFSITAIRRLWHLCYFMPTAYDHLVQLLVLLLSRCPRMYPLDLTLPRRNRCHHRPIHQLRSLPYACLFVPQTVEY